MKQLLSLPLRCGVLARVGFGCGARRCEGTWRVFCAPSHGKIQGEIDVEFSDVGALRGGIL